MLVDISGSFVYGDVLTEIKKAGKITKEMTLKEAVVGISGGKKILLKIVQSFTNMNLKVLIPLMKQRIGSLVRNY